MFSVRDYVSNNGGNPEDVKQRIAAKAVLDKLVKAGKLNKTKNGREVMFSENAVEATIVVEATNELGSNVVDLTEACRKAAAKKMKFSGYKVDYSYNEDEQVHSRIFKNEEFMELFIERMNGTKAGTIVKSGPCENGEYVD